VDDFREMFEIETYYEPLHDFLNSIKNIVPPVGNDAERENYSQEIESFLVENNLVRERKEICFKKFIDKLKKYFEKDRKLNLIVNQSNGSGLYKKKLGNLLEDDDHNVELNDDSVRKQLEIKSLISEYEALCVKNKDRGNAEITTAVEELISNWENNINERRFQQPIDNIKKLVSIFLRKHPVYRTSFSLTYLL
jgi:hypothetical protein